LRINLLSGASSTDLCLNPSQESSGFVLLSGFDSLPKCNSQHLLNKSTFGRLVGLLGIFFVQMFVLIFGNIADYHNDLFTCNVVLAAGKLKFSLT